MISPGRALDSFSAGSDLLLVYHFASIRCRLLDANSPAADHIWPLVLLYVQLFFWIHGRCHRREHWTWSHPLASSLTGCLAYYRTSLSLKRMSNLLALRVYPFPVHSIKLTQRGQDELVMKQHVSLLIPQLIVAFNLNFLNYFHSARTC